MFFFIEAAAAATSNLAEREAPAKRTMMMPALQAFLAEGTTLMANIMAPFLEVMALP